MSTDSQHAILSIALMAAYADGHQADTERDTVRQLATSLGGSEGQALARVVQDVLLKRVSLADAASSLEDAGQRQLAYEMAVCVCDADGRQSDAERAFLAELKTHLKLDPAAAAAFEREADADRGCRREGGAGCGAAQRGRRPGGGRQPWRRAPTSTSPS